MLRTTNDMTVGQTHSIRVEKLPDGRYKASESILGDDIIAPAIAPTQDQAIGLLNNKIWAYDQSGEKQK